MAEAITTIAALQARLDECRRSGRTIACVPTMGALHEGHLALVNRAHERADVVVVSIFINPLQFGPNEDLGLYPRTLEADLAALAVLPSPPRGVLGGTRPQIRPRDAQNTARQAVTIAFAPTVAEMYPHGELQTRVAAGAVAELFEGATRPGHFDGMLTVVAKLFNIVQPTVAVFGQKDAQQVYLVRRMIADLNLPVALDVVDTVRESDGLALSSRNRYLAAGEKRAALVLSSALADAAASAPEGADFARVAGRNAVADEPLAALDYFELVDPQTFLPVAADFCGRAIAIIAARIGATRLIDNRSIDVGAMPTA